MEQRLSYNEYRDKSAAAAKRAAREIILLCTTPSLSLRSKQRLRQIMGESVDWRYLLGLASFQGVIPLVKHNLSVTGITDQIPQPYLSRLQQEYNRIVYRNVVLSGDLAKVLSAFTQCNIQAMCLKGTVLAEVLYGNPALRPILDLDVLVHYGDIPLARMVLAKLGYKAVSDYDPHHPFHGKPYCKNEGFPRYLELHWGLDDDKLTAFPEQEIWHRAMPVEVDGVSTLTLSPEDNLLFMANHLSKHDNHCLKFLGDIAALTKKYEHSLDWSYVTASACAWHIEATVYYALRRSQEFIGAPVPTLVLTVLKPNAWRWWLLDFLLGPEVFISPIMDHRLRSETSALARSLMMINPRQMRAVLVRQRGVGKKGVWLRELFWVMRVLVAGLKRYISRAERRAVIIRVLRVLFIRARYIFRTKGLIALFRSGINFILWRLRLLVRYCCEYRVFYLYEHTMKERSEADFIPKISDFTFNIVSSNQQADELVNNGYQDFRDYWRTARQGLDSGAIAFCVFVKRELAHISWVATANEAKNTFDPWPYYVDFSTNQVCIGGTWTWPKFRGKGLMPYVYFKTFQFLRERGVNTCRNTVLVDNTASQRVHAKFGPRIYAKVHYLRIAHCYLRRETPLIQTDHYQHYPKSH